MIRVAWYARLLAVAGIVVAAAGWAREGRAEEPPAPTEYEVKAAFLYHFTNYVEWPVGLFANDGAPFTIGVLGRDPFGPALETAVQGRSSHQHRIVIARFPPGEKPGPCQLLFVCRSEKNRLPEILRLVDGKSVLTVAELDHFCEAGGMIDLYESEARIRFAINPDATRKANLRVSSQLLSLARIVSADASGR